MWNLPPDHLGIRERREYRVCEPRRAERRISYRRSVATRVRCAVFEEKMNPYQSVFICVSLILMTMLPNVTAQTRRQPVDLLVVGGTIVTMDQERRTIPDGGIAVSQGRIVAIGPRAEVEREYTSRHKVNATGKVITPGLINGHTHIPMVLFRGLADDLDLQEWLTKYIFPPGAKKVTEQVVGVEAGAGAAGARLGGTTTYCDMYYFEDAIADETAKAGVRGVLGETIIDFPVADNKTNAEGMAYVEKFVNHWKGHELIVPAIAPHAPYTVSEAHLKAVRAFSDRTGAPIVTHISETKRELDDSVKDKGASPVAYLSRIGFLNDHVVAAHMVWPNSGEIEILKRAGVGVVHNPQSNMKLASGVAPVPKMMADGLRIGLGTDGAASNKDLRLWGGMGQAGQ